MSDKPVLYGFDDSTYVRTTRCALHSKSIDYDQIPLNVLEGEPKQLSHLERHPFGKVPVLDIDGMRLRETSTICRYLDESRLEPALMPDNPKDRARANQCIDLIDSYGYGALLGVAGYHLFPDFLGNPSEAVHQEHLDRSHAVLKLLMEIRDGDDWLVGNKATLADYFLGPIIAYVSMTPHKDEMLGIDGMGNWWARLEKDEIFAATAPG